MKLIYSELKKFLPDLSVDPHALRDDLSMIGHFCNFYEEVEGEIVFDFDIKVNRGDCLGYYGLVRDLAVLYNLHLITPGAIPPVSQSAGLPPLPIKVTTNNVTRVMAVKLSAIKNGASPDWLQRFIRLHGTNPINILVDLTNYVMFLYGIPAHAFDIAKSGEELIWEMNPKYKEFRSLDGSVLKLHNDVLMVNNPNKALSLSFWGGEACAIENTTTDTIIELAVYNPAVVRQNSRSLKSVTEASVRLEKTLDPQLIPLAFRHLSQLITDLTGGQVSSQIFDYYPQPIAPTPVEFDFDLSSRLAGIKISQDFSIDCLTRLGCTINGNLITPPTIRKDLTIPEDLAEEIIRFYGYQNIPISEPLKPKDVSDITPKVLYLIDKLKDELVGEGYDEVLTWPLVNKPQSGHTIQTQNSINDEYIYLRESLIPSLKLQLEQYNRYKLPHPKFFEIGKIFSKAGDKYVEKFALGKYDGEKFSESVLDDMTSPDSYTPKNINNKAVELTSQIITLDANVTIKGKPDPLELIKKYSDMIDPAILWSMEITDIFENKYTFRVRYYNSDDKTAKKNPFKNF